MDVNTDKEEKVADRLLQFLNDKNISKSEFADSLGIGRSNITHIFTGRNNVSDKTLSKILSTYPDINPMWLVTGNGEMLIEKPELREKIPAEEKPDTTLFHMDGDNDDEEDDEEEEDEAFLGGNKSNVNERVNNSCNIEVKQDEIQVNSSKKMASVSASEFQNELQPVSGTQILQAKSVEKKIQKIVFFYTDKTFSEYYPE